MHCKHAQGVKWGQNQILHIWPISGCVVGSRIQSLDEDTSVDIDVGDHPRKHEWESKEGRQVMQEDLRAGCYCGPWDSGRMRWTGTLWR